MSKSYGSVIAMGVVVSLLPGLANSYIGPGAGLSAIGTILALIGAVALGIVGFVWYPIKRIMTKRRQRRENSTNETK